MLDEDHTESEERKVEDNDDDDDFEDFKQSFKCRSEINIGGHQPDYYNIDILIE